VNHFGDRRRAGISVPLFSLRSRSSWGIGEMRDLPVVAEWLRAAGQSILQILPLNELSRDEASPYSALSAMAIDPRYITIRDLPDAADFEALWPEEIASVREAGAIDYRKVAELKHLALRICFARFFENDWEDATARGDELRSYIRKESWWLDEYALYRALRASFDEQPWPEWPAAFRDRDPAELVAAQRRLEYEILFYQYVQWVADAQWRSARAAATGVAVFGDVPFMVSLDSADVWSRQKEFLLDASVGTPPDAFSETGQEWGLPPYNWTVAKTNDLQWLRQRARRMSELYDGFRLDHLVGFYRTYVRPLNGEPPYFLPAEENDQRELGETVLRIMMETGAVVSVEDLGTVPPFVRISVARVGLPGYRVFRWEPEDPATYPETSIAMTGTHDTEPIATWWDSLEPAEREKFAKMDSLQVDPKRPFDNVIRDAILRAMYWSGSSVVLTPIQDIFGWRSRINRPASVGDWNWTYVLPWPVDLMMTQPEALDGIRRLRKIEEETGR
jgi:4-alpha-glucanotransferase